MTSPQIDIIYEATTPLGVDLGVLTMALQLQVDRDVTPIWGLACTLDIQSASRSGVQRLIFLDDADQADALGYHELTPDGLPQGKVFVRTTLKDGENPTVTASHELLEMMVDPNIDQVCYRHTRHTTYAKEVCDAVEESTYTIDINGVKVLVSNFQTPAWFDLGPSTPQRYDYLGLCKSPWQLLRGGYMSVQLADGEWSQVFGSVHAASRFNSAKKWRPQVLESGVKRRSTR